MATFVALGILFLVQGQLFAVQKISVLGVVFAYFIGMLVRLGSPGQSPLRDDVKATVVVSLTLAAAVVAVFRIPVAPLPGWVENVVLGLVLFYFGSR
jgi:hypothetical protein